MTTDTQATIRLRPQDSDKEPSSTSRLYLRHGNNEMLSAVWELFEREQLTSCDIREFCRKSSQSSLPPSTAEDHPNYKYRARRREIQHLLRQFPSGGARIDEYGRLVSNTTSSRTFVPVTPLPALPAVRPRIRQPQHLQQHGRVRGQEENEMASAAIARAVERYRRAGISDSQLRLVRAQPSEHIQADAAHQPNNQQRFRRICIAAIAVTASFLCILLRTLPLWQMTLFAAAAAPRHSAMDPLQEAILSVKHMVPHSRLCGSTLDRTPPPPPSSIQSARLLLHRIIGPKMMQGRIDRLLFRMLFALESLLQATHRLLLSSKESYDCSDGVLHIPTQRAVISQFLKANTKSEVDLLDPFVSRGIDLSWELECHPPPNASGVFMPTQCSVDPLEHQCRTAGRCQQKCFRGVHDDILAESEIQDALRFGSHLILQGGDHFDIHNNIPLLQQRLPKTVETLQTLLQDRYNVSLARPVAYRVNAVGPIDGDGVPLYGLHSSSNYLVRIVNRSRYIGWMEKAELQNELAQLPLPWPLRNLVPPARDTCNLVADLDADPSFAVQTTVFLSEGAGAEYRGGTFLFVDYRNNRKDGKIRRGVSIDGSRGRVVVSTGGRENRRCRLPTRSGVRATLQVWWHINSSLCSTQSS